MHIKYKSTCIYTRMQLVHIHRLQRGNKYKVNCQSTRYKHHLNCLQNSNMNKPWQSSFPPSLSMRNGKFFITSLIPWLSHAIEEFWARLQSIIQMLNIQFLLFGLWISYYKPIHAFYQRHIATIMQTPTVTTISSPNLKGVTTQK